MAKWYTCVLSYWDFCCNTLYATIQLGLVFTFWKMKCIWISDFHLTHRRNLEKCFCIFLKLARWTTTWKSCHISCNVFKFLELFSRLTSSSILLEQQTRNFPGSAELASQHNERTIRAMSLHFGVCKTWPVSIWCNPAKSLCLCAVSIRWIIHVWKYSIITPTPLEGC